MVDHPYLQPFKKGGQRTRAAAPSSRQKEPRINPPFPSEGQPRLASSIASVRTTRLAAYRWLWAPLLMFGATRLAIALMGILAAVLVTDNTNPPPYHLRPPDNILLDIFGSRWDTGFYVNIAEEGYRYRGVPLPSVAFFPLLPLTMRALTLLVGDAVVAGVLIANLALLLATILFYRLVQDEWGEPIADRAVWYLLIFPTSFFGSAIYSESLFLLTAVGAFHFARRGFWESAAMSAFFAGLSRFMGLLVAPLLALEWWRQRRRNSAGWLSGFTALMAPAGALTYMLYLDRNFGDPLAFSNASAVWERAPRPPWELVAELFQRPAQGWWAALLGGKLPLDHWLDFLLVAFFLILGIVLLWEQRWAEGSFVTFGALLTLSSGLLMSQRRYVWVLFPAFILLARWGDLPWVDRLVTCLSLLGLGLFTTLFANGYWVA